MLGEHHRLESHPIADEGGGTLQWCRRLLLFNAARYCSRRSGRVESAIPYLAFSGEGVIPLGVPLDAAMAISSILESRPR